MAFDEGLAERVRATLEELPELRERRMFGGIAFMVGGHMACGIVGDDLMLRLGEDSAREALGRPHVRPMDFTGKPMATMVFVEPDGFESDEDLAAWVELAVDYAHTLPAK